MALNTSKCNHLTSRPFKGLRTPTSRAVETIAKHLLNTATKRLVDVSVPGNLVEVSVTSEEEVKGQCQLSEGAFGRSVNCRFTVELQDTATAMAPQVR